MNNSKVLAVTLKSFYGEMTVSKLMNQEFCYESEDNVYALNLLGHVFSAFKEQNEELSGFELQMVFEEYLEELWVL